MGGQDGAERHILVYKSSLETQVGIAFQMEDLMPGIHT